MTATASTRTRSPLIRFSCAGHAEAIRVLGRRVVADIIEIGQRLIAVKAVKQHGEWYGWLEDNFSWTDRAARNYMAVAEAFADKSESLSDLNITGEALYLLAGPTVPHEARDAAIEKAEVGDRITKAEAERLIADARAAERGAIEAPRLTGWYPLQKTDRH